jgi:hypothetical protein
MSFTCDMYKAPGLGIEDRTHQVVLLLTNTMRWGESSLRSFLSLYTYSFLQTYD